MEEVVPAYGPGPLLLIALGAVAVLLVLIMVLRLHAFVALILVSLLTALVAGIPVGDAVPTVLEGFGTTLASVALLVGLGAMIGKLLEVTGGAQVLADTLVARFGERRAPLALGIASLLFGFPIFFDAGFVVFLPIIFSVARRFGGSVLLYALPAAGAFAVMHAFVPPHPGPVGAAGILDADIGLVLLAGLVIGIPTWFIASYLFSRWAGRRYVVPVPAILAGGDVSGGRAAANDDDTSPGTYGDGDAGGSSIGTPRSRRSEHHATVQHRAAPAAPAAGREDHAEDLDGHGDPHRPRRLRPRARREPDPVKGLGPRLTPPS